MMKTTNDRLQDDVVAARPDIDQKVEQLVSRGRWAVPGYNVSLLTISRNKSDADDRNRRNSATSLCYKCFMHSDHFIESTVYISVLSSFSDPRLSRDLTACKPRCLHCATTKALGWLLRLCLPGTQRLTLCCIRLNPRMSQLRVCRRFPTLLALTLNPGVDIRPASSRQLVT